MSLKACQTTLSLGCIAAGQQVARSSRAVVTQAARGTSCPRAAHLQHPVSGGKCCRFELHGRSSLSSGALSGVKITSDYNLALPLQRDLLLREEAGLVFVTHGWCRPCDRDGESSHITLGFLQKAESACLCALPYLAGVPCWGPLLGHTVWLHC